MSLGAEVVLGNFDAAHEIVPDTYNKGLIWFAISSPICFQPSKSVCNIEKLGLKVFQRKGVWLFYVEIKDDRVKL